MVDLVYLVHLVYLVYLVCFVDLVYLVCFVYFVCLVGLVRGIGRQISEVRHQESEIGLQRSEVRDR